MRFLQNHWLSIVLIFSGIGVGGRIFSQTDKRDIWFLRCHQVKAAFDWQYHAKNFHRTFHPDPWHFAEKAMFSLLEALDITANSIGNLVFQKHLLKMKQMATKGEPMESSISTSNLFPPLVVQMIAVGEETAETGLYIEQNSRILRSRN